GPPPRSAGPPTSCILICIYRSMTYRPGAASSGGCCALPSAPGGRVISFERALIQSSQCGHQLPLCFAACSRQASAPAAVAAPVQKQALGLPGGLIRLWIWPLVACTEGLRPPYNFAVL